MQEKTTSTSSGELASVPLTGADKVAYAFYATAATAALVGQVWAGVTHIPWPEGFSAFMKIALVTPAVAVIELGGVATAALADLRRRKGEQAYAYRAMSLFAALVALVFNVVGHWRPEERFLAFGFGGLSAFAYVLWLIHSSARRRDALRNAGQMANTGPVYGVVQWLREPRLTWQARNLAIEHGYGMFESLRAAKLHVRNQTRRQAIAGTVAEYIRSEHQDERLAKIAETTYDADRLAGMLEERINYEVVTNKLTAAISPPPEPEPEPEPRGDLRAAVWVVEGATPRPRQLRGADSGVSLRDEDAWGEAMTGELMAVDFQAQDRGPDTDGVAEAVVVDEGEPQHVVPGSGPGRPVNGKPAAKSGAEAAGRPAAIKPAGIKPAGIKPHVPQPKAEPVVQKPQPPSPFAPEQVEPEPALIRTPKKPAAKVEPVLSEPVLVDPAPAAKSGSAVKSGPAAKSGPATAEEPAVVAREVTSRTTSKPASASEEGEPSVLEKKRRRAWALLSDWPDDRERTPQTLAAAIASSEPMAARFIEQYDTENGLVTTQS